MIPSSAIENGRYFAATSGALESGGDMKAQIDRLLEVL
jgi:hypothetical protein